LPETFPPTPTGVPGTNRALLAIHRSVVTSPSRITLPFSPPKQPENVQMSGCWENAPKRFFRLSEENGKLHVSEAAGRGISFGSGTLLKQADGSFEGFLDVTLERDRLDVSRRFPAKCYLLNGNVLVFHIALPRSNGTFPSNSAYPDGWILLRVASPAQPSTVQYGASRK
jgi:hypothetical protein